MENFTITASLLTLRPVFTVEILWRSCGKPVENFLILLITPFTNTSREFGFSPSSNDVKQLSDYELEGLLEDKHLLLSGKANISVIRNLAKEIKLLESSVREIGRLKPQFKQLLTVPGIGDVKWTPLSRQKLTKVKLLMPI